MGVFIELLFHKKKKNALQKGVYMNHINLKTKWTASSEFGTYRLGEQRRFRRACASRSLARTFAARSCKQWAKRNLQTESQIPGRSEWLGMRS